MVSKPPRFTMPCSTKKRLEQGFATNLINTMPKIEKLLDELEPPAVVRVYRPTPRELVFKGKPGRVQPKTLGGPERSG